MIVGLTGGIGSGKSTVIERFKNIGNIAIYIADIEAKKIMTSSAKIKKDLIKIFGEAAYKENTLNREFIATIVFKDSQKLAALNAVVHPEVFKHFKEFAAQHKDKDYILYENAILFENGSHSFCDFIITVIADEALRIKRVVQRDKTNSEAVIHRMNNQWKDVKKILRSHYIIENNERESLDSQVVRIHNNLTKSKPYI